MTADHPPLTNEQLDTLLEDWHKPVFDELGLCRAHQLTLPALRAAIADPRFTMRLDHVRAIRAERAPDLAAASHALAIERLTYLAQYNPTNATFAHEIRLALKDLRTLVELNPVHAHDEKSESWGSATPALASRTISRMRQLAAPLILLALFLTAPTAAQPALQPDESAAAYIARWNSWAAETDPDQQLIADLEATTDAIDAALDRVDDNLRVYRPLEDLTNPRSWPAATTAAEVIAPHTARLRELLGAPHLALPFRGPEIEIALRAEGEAVPPGEDHIVFDRGPLPEDHLEVLILGFHFSSPVHSAVGRLRSETDYAIHTGNIGLAVKNITAYLDAYRLTAERGTTIDVLTASAIESTALAAIERLLLRHSDRLRDPTLEHLQSALLDHAESRRSLAATRQLEDAAFAELLPSCFEPDRPGRLTDRGRHFLEPLAKEQLWIDAFDPDARFVLREAPSIDADFAAASEQVRAFKNIAEAFTRDAAKPWHAIDTLESADIFRFTQEADPEARLAPALSAFALYNKLLVLDLQSEIDLRAALTILAVHRHRAITGEWPKSLTDVDPAVLRVDPTDPHSGRPFAYAVINNQPTLWSAGPDRDDDAGRSIPEPTTVEGELPKSPAVRWFTTNEWNALPPAQQAVYDGDITLYPPDPR
jgi:hypothetical protein